MKRITLILFLFVFAACARAPKQAVKPIPADLPSPICLVRNLDVREGFREALERQIEDHGYSTRVIRRDPEGCPVLVVYYARWDWDLALFMQKAAIRAYSDGLLVGEASYDASRSGMSFKKFIDAEEKVQSLVGEMFPPR